MDAASQGGGCLFDKHERREYFPWFSRKDNSADMKRVGILVGREKTFPEALINGINERGRGDVVAEYIKLGGVKYDDPPKYDLVIDRISHEVPFYRATLKRMALEGTMIINNPFWWSSDDKFFNYSLGKKLGVAIPKTVLLPQKDYIDGIVSESLRNLEFPLDWQGIIDIKAGEAVAGKERPVDLLLPILPPAPAGHGRQKRVDLLALELLADDLFVARPGPDGKPVRAGCVH